MGFVEPRDGKGISLAEKNDLNSLMDPENRDRRALYLEVAKSMNISPDQLSKVQRIFAEKWQHSTERGWWILKENGQRVQK
jgi:uncharacterized protein